jgi:hypothetical protein
MRRTGGVLVAAMAAVLAVPADAAADRFRGKSEQGRVVTLRTGDDGLVQRFAIRWIGDCERPRYRFASSTKNTPRVPFEVSTADRFVDVGGYRQRLGGGKRAVLRARTVGNRVSARRWTGIFRIRVRVFRGGDLIDRCRLSTRWRVVRRG